MSRLGTPPKGTFGLSLLGHVIGAAAQPIAGKPAHRDRANLGICALPAAVGAGYGLKPVR
ncbi:hypothetical protein D9M71_140860 [compost metagenome]